jgi:hypothetical protein
MLARTHPAVATFAVGACICGLRKASSPAMSPATMSAASTIHLIRMARTPHCEFTTRIALGAGQIASPHHEL